MILINNGPDPINFKVCYLRLLDRFPVLLKQIFDLKHNINCFLLDRALHSETKKKFLDSKIGF